MKNIFEAPFVREMEKTTANMYRLGWDERNGGNVSYLLDEKEVAESLDLNHVIRTIPTGFDAKPLIGKIFIVTGTGKYFKNVESDPETNLGIVRIGKDGTTAELLWGYKDGGRFAAPYRDGHASYIHHRDERGVPAGRKRLHETPLEVQHGSGSGVPGRRRRSSLHDLRHQRNRRSHGGENERFSFGGMDEPRHLRHG